MLTRPSNILPLAVLTAVMCCALGGSILSAFRARSLKAILFAPADVAATPARAAASGVVRARYVTVDVAALLATRSSEANETTRPTLLLNLFDDLSYSAVFDRLDQAEGGFTWVGHLQGVDGSAATLAQVDGVMAGTIIVPGAVYTVRYVGQGVHEVLQIDPTRQREELEPLPVEPAGVGTILAPEFQRSSTAVAPVAGPVAGQVSPSVPAPSVTVGVSAATPPLSEARVDFIDPMATAVAGVNVSREPIAVRQAGGDWQWVSPDQDAPCVIEVVEANEVEVRMPRAGSVRYAGYEVVEHQRQGLPVGSLLDGPKGVFIWRRTAGVSGRVDLEFVGDDGAAVLVRLEVHPTSPAATTRSEAASTPPAAHP